MLYAWFLDSYRHKSLTAIKDPQKEVVAIQGVELKSDLVAAQVAARRTFIRQVSYNPLSPFHLLPLSRK